MAKTLKEMRVATPQTRGMAGSRGIMRKKTGPRGANKKEKVYEPTRGQLNNIRRRGEGISSTTKFMDQVRSIAPSVYNHPKVQDIFRNHAETNESVGKTPGDRSYYNLQKAKELAKKAGHDYDKLPQYDRRHNDHKDYFDNKAKNEDVSKADRVARSSMMKKPNPVNITRAGINKAGRDALKKATTSHAHPDPMYLQKMKDKKKSTSEAVNPHDDEGSNHIVMQLRKAVTLRGMRPVEFKDGKKVKVDVGHAQKFLSKYNQAKPADKEKMQAKAQKSHGHFKSTISEEFELNEDPSKSLKDKSEKSRIPVSILRSVYNRGMAAWKGGHRKGMAQQQWAHARVNSFISKGSGTWGKADKDLADKARAAMKSKKNESVNEDRMAGKYRKGQTIIRGQWPNPDKWAEEYIMPNADRKGVKIYSTGPAFVIEKL